MRRDPVITRESAIASMASSIKSGSLSRETRLGFESEDITEAVHLLAGPETDAEREMRAQIEEARFPMRLGGALASDLHDSFFTGSRLYFLGEQFEIGEHDFADELVLVRKADGKRYRIEIDVYAQELVDEPVAEEGGPGPGQQALV